METDLHDMLIHGDYHATKQNVHRLVKAMETPSAFEAVLIYGTPDIMDLVFKARGERPFTWLPESVMRRRDKMAYLIANHMVDATVKDNVFPCGMPWLPSM